MLVAVVKYCGAVACPIVRGCLVLFTPPVVTSVLRVLDHRTKRRPSLARFPVSVLMIRPIRESGVVLFRVLVDRPLGPSLSVAGKPLPHTDFA